MQHGPVAVFANCGCDFPLVYIKIENNQYIIERLYRKSSQQHEGKNLFHNKKSAMQK